MHADPSRIARVTAAAAIPTRSMSIMPGGGESSAAMRLVPPADSTDLETCIRCRSNRFRAVHAYPPRPWVVSRADQTVRRREPVHTSLFGDRGLDRAGLKMLLVPTS